MMEKLVAGSVVIILAMLSLFFFVIFSAFLGGVAGWVVGLAFGDTILGILGQLGIKGVTMFQLGVFMGFMGGFMKTKVTVTAKKDK